MDAAQEFKKRFPEEKVISVSRARVKAFSTGTGAGRLRLPSGASIVVSKGFVAFIFDATVYYIIMGLLALLSLVVAVLLLLGSLNIMVFLVIMLGLLVVVLAEGVLFMEANRARMTVFDRAAAEVVFDKEARTLRISGIPLGSEWLGEKRSFGAVLEEGAEEPAL